jgi:hypothetical protein
LKIFHDFRYIDDKAGMSKWEGDFFLPTRPPTKIDLCQAGINRIIVVNPTSSAVKTTGWAPKGNSVVAAAGVRRLKAGGQGPGQPAR